MTNKENMEPRLDTQGSPQEDSELRYLLSAYLFDSLSDEGRAEVEDQLEKSEACRRELEELRETLSMVSEALSDEPARPSLYSFDQRRMDRVLSAKRRASILRLRFPSRKVIAAAALVLFSMTGILGLLTYSSLEKAAPTDSRDMNFASKVLTLDSDRRTGGNEPLEGEAYTGNLESKREDRPGGKERRSLAPNTISQPKIMRKLADSLPPPTSIKGSISKAERFYADEDGETPKDGTARASNRKRAAAGKPAPPAPASRKAEADTGEMAAKKQNTANENGVKVTDVIGVGGGAAGAYGHRYAKARLVRAKPKFGKSARKPSAPAAPPAPEPVPEEPGSPAVSSLSFDSRPQEEQKEKESAVEGLKSIAKEVEEKKKDISKSQQDKNVQQQALIESESSIADNSEIDEGFIDEDESSEVADEKSFLLEKLQNSQQAEDVFQRQEAQTFDLNIKKTPEGYQSLGLGRSSAQFHNDEPGAPAFDLTRTINEKVLNTFSFYRRLDPKLTYDQFNSRALVIPPPALGDEGLGEKGFRKRYGVNPFVATNRDHLSTFGLDVDTASWGRTRESLRNKQLPPPGTIRVEEFINNFSDDRPGNPDSVFSVYTEGGPSPFGDHDLELIQVTLKSRALRSRERKDAILTFAVDTSGSMAANGKIRLLQESLRTLVEKLSPADRVAIVAFSTNAYVVLPHTSVRQRAEILGAIESLTPTGGTNVEAGIDLAYRLAGEASHKRASNRVILCSDGVANLGARGPEAILNKISRFARDDRIALYTYAFGSGGRQAVKGDKMLQQLANRGDGRYQYVDSSSTSGKIFSVPDRLQVLAADAKIQVDFNPDVVSHYRLLGYEKRDIADKDFRNDSVDAGEVGPGSTVTALYEIKRSRPVGSIGRVYLRYKDTVSITIEEFNYELHPGILAAHPDDTSDRFRFIASVAEFAELLRGSYYARNGSFGATLQLMGEVSAEFKKREAWKEAYRAISSAQGLSAVQTLNSIR